MFVHSVVATSLMSLLRFLAKLPGNVKTGTAAHQQSPVTLTVNKLASYHPAEAEISWGECSSHTTPHLTQCGSIGLEFDTTNTT